MDAGLPIDRRKIFIRVAEQLEQQILGGAFKPGDTLPAERDLRAMFGVGRPAIRQALIKLKEAGLIEIGNGTPARVITPDPARIVASILPAVQQFIATAEGEKQLRGVRLFLEVAVVRHVARHASDEDLARIRAIVDANGRAIGDLEAFIATDVAFHRSFAAAVANPVLMAIYDAMSAWLLAQRRASVAGLDFATMDEDALARARRGRIGIVLQAFHLLPTMTALENVAVPLELAGIDDPFGRAARELEAVGLGHRLTHYPAQLSGGEQQRVAIARALVAAPALVWADEPTGNLDSETAAEVMDLLGEVNAAGQSLVIVTHDPGIGAGAPRLVTMRDGRIVSDVAASPAPVGAPGRA